MVSLVEGNKIIHQLDKGREHPETGVKLIAPENFVSMQTMETAGSALLHKYADDDDDESGFCCPCCLPR